jgi:hypothetical protein
MDETAEWRRVYDEFLRLKKECGETTDGLNFEKFKSTLRKNRDQLLQRHGCKSVKFSVYMKEGKAALKANPIASNDSPRSTEGTSRRSVGFDSRRAEEAETKEFLVAFPKKNSGLRFLRSSL